MAHVSAPHQSTLLKVIGLCIAALILLVLLFISFLPMLLSTTSGRQLLMKTLRSNSGFDVQIEGLSLSWFGAQHVSGLRGQNMEEQLSFSCQEIKTDSPLWQILFNQNLGEIHILAPQLQLAKPFHTASKSGKRLLQAASFVPEVQLAMPAIDLPFTGRLRVDQGKVLFQPPGLEPVVFDQIALAVDLSEKEELAVALDCATQRAQISGKIALTGSASQLKAPFPNLSLQSSVSHLPVAGIDQLVSLFEPKSGGLLYAVLGETLDMQCNLSASKGNFDLKIDLRSPQLALQAAAQTAEGTVALTTPATCQLNLTPALFAKLATAQEALRPLTLTQPATLLLTVPRFSCPLSSLEKDLLQSSFQATLAGSSQLLFSLEGKPLTIGNLKLAVECPSLDAGINFIMTSSLQGEGNIVAEGKISHPLSQAMEGMVMVNASSLPVDLIGVDIPLANLLGPTATLQGTLEIGGGNPQAHISWESKFLSIPHLDISLTNPYTLISPASLTFGFNPEVLKAERVAVTLDNLVIPADNIKEVRLSATLNTGKIALSDPLPMNVPPLKVVLSVATLRQIGVDIDSEQLKASLAGAYDMATSRVSLTKPLFVQYTLGDAELQKLWPVPFHLAIPATFKLSVDPLTLPLENIQPGSLKCSGKIDCQELALNTLQRQIVLRETSLPFQWDGRGKTASVQITAQALNPSSGAGSIQGQWSLSNFSIDQGLKAATLKGALDVQNISSTLLDTLSERISARSFLGPEFSSKLKLESSPDRQNLFLQWTSPLLNINSSFLIDKEGIRLGSGGTNQINWTMTPEAYRFLDQWITGGSKGGIPFEIKEASTFTLSLGTLSLPVTPKKEISSLLDRIPDITFDLPSLELAVTGNNPLLSFLETTSKESIRLENLSFSLNKSGGNGPLMATLDSQLLTQSASQSVKSGSISLSGNLQETLGDKGAFDLSKLTAGLALKVHQLPSRALDLIARAKGRTDFPFTTLFGDMVNANCKIDLNNFSGPVLLNVNTPLTRVDLVGKMVNGALVLEDTFHTQMRVTPELSRLGLKEINPLNLSYLYSQAPITLEIPAKGFYLPLYPFSLGKIAIPDATIELGKIFCRNEGNINIALGLLKAAQTSKTGELSLWFAPIDIAIKQGVVNIDRTEILIADTFDVCLWGKVDLLQDYVDMVLGLTADTLGKAFRIKNLPENYVLTIPMKGKSDNVKIDSGKATAKVALLLAWQNKNVAGAFGGGTAGALFGEFLGKVATLPDANAKVPPAKRPFPWEIGKGGKTSHASQHKKRNFKGDEKPLKQILKVIR